MRRIGPLTSVWALLCVVTVATWLLGIEGTRDRNTVITVGVLALSLVKVRLVLRWFMEVRTAPRWLRHATDAWLAAAWTTILVIYLVV